MFAVTSFIQIKQLLQNYSIVYLRSSNMISIRFSLIFLSSLIFSAPAITAQQDHSVQHNHTAPVSSKSTKADGKKPGVFGYDVFGSQNRTHAVTAEREATTEHLVYKQSDNYGKTWSVNSVIENSENKIYSAARGAYPQIAVNSELIVIVWNLPGNTRFGSGELSTVYSRDNGKTWVAGKSPSDLEKSDSQNFADLFVTESGRIGLVWLDSRDNKQGLRLSFFDVAAGLWGKNITLDAETCQCCWNKAVAVKDSNALVLYRDISPRDMSVANFDLVKNEVKSVGPIYKFNWDFNACPHRGGGLDAITDKNTNTIVATFWNGNPTDSQYFSKSVDLGQTWEKPIKINKEGLEHGDAAINKKSIVLVFFNAKDGKIYYSKSSHRKLNQNYKKISESKKYQKSPQVLSINNNFVVSWIEEGEKNELKTSVIH